MAENKKSFLLYCDLIHTVKKMPKEKAGELFLHILEYVNDLDPITEDLVVDLTFEPIKQQLKRDLKKYESIKDRNKKNGKKGGRPIKPNKPKEPTGLIDNPKEPKKAVTDTVTVIDNVTDTDNVILLKQRIQNYLINSFTWKEAVLRKLKTNGINSTILVIDKFIRNFAIELEATEDLYKTDHENKKHFTHWVTIQLKNEKTTTNKKQSRNESNAEHNAKTAEELGFNQ